MLGLAQFVLNLIEHVEPDDLYRHCVIPVSLEAARVTPRGDVLMAVVSVRIARLIARATRDDRGASLVEYAFLVALIAAVCVVAISVLGINVGDTLTNVNF
jgi:Flp pilus assembly pilin Flp